MDKDGELEREDGSVSAPNDMIRQTAGESVVAVVFIGMLFTAFLAWTDMVDGTGDFRICEYDVHGLGFWIYEHDEKLCWFSVTDMIGVGVFMTIIMSPLTFSVSFLAILIWHSKHKSGHSTTGPKY